jgi:phage baseplate assembly protein W
MGMDINTGKLLSGVDHLKQSIHDILITFFGTRVMRRTYGSELFALIDAAGNKETIVRVYYAVAVALHLWEPRFDLERVQASDQTMTGTMNFTMEGQYLGQKIEIRNIQI